MCRWQKCHEAEIAERDAERAETALHELRTAIEDHRRGLIEVEDLYAIIDRDRILARQR